MKKTIRINVMPNKNLKNSSGFTLVEILVVVLILGILGSVLIKTLNIQGLQRKARDSQRKADLRKIQTSLELYFADNRQYPVDVDNSGAGLQTLNSNGYLSAIPYDPNTGNRYYYVSATGATYVLACQMEISSSVDDKPCSGAIPGITANECYQLLPPR